AGHPSRGPDSAIDFKPPPVTRTRQKHKRQTMQRILLYSALFTLAAWSAEAAEVRLKAEAACSGAIVRLKDVADIVSTDENEAAALAELQLFPIPSAGKVRNVRRGEIRELLALSDVNLQAVTLSGAEKLVVRRTESQASAKTPAPATAA